MFSINQIQLLLLINLDRRRDRLDKMIDKAMKTFH